MATPKDSDHLWQVEAFQEIAERFKASDQAESDALSITTAYKLMTQPLNIARTSHLLTPDDTAEMLVEKLDGSVGWNPDADSGPHWGFMYRGEDGLWRRFRDYQDLGKSHVDPAMQALQEMSVSKAFLNLSAGNKHVAKNVAALQATAASLQHRTGQFKKTLVSAKDALRVERDERLAHVAMWIINYGVEADLVDFRTDYRASGYPGGLLDKQLKPLLNDARLLHRDGTGMVVTPQSGLKVLEGWIAAHQQ